MRVLLIEDDEITASAIISHFTRQGLNIDYVTGCEDLVYQDLWDAFDVLILDVGLPGLSGLNFLHDIRNMGISIPILMFTAQYEIDARVRALNMGADDYLTKPFDMRELFARCQALARRKVPTKSIYIKYRDLRIDTGAKTAEKFGTPLSFTPKVFSLLCYIIENKGRVLTRQQIEEHLYGWDGEAESNTVEVFISQIRRKIGAEYVRTVRGIGYIAPLEHL